MWHPPTRTEPAWWITAHSLSQRGGLCPSSGNINRLMMWCDVNLSDCSCGLVISQTQAGALLCVNYFTTTTLKTVKENIGTKPVCPRNKSSNICDIRQPALGPRGGLRPIPSHREEACVPAVGTLKRLVMNLSEHERTHVCEQLPEKNLAVLFVCFFRFHRLFHRCKFFIWYMSVFIPWRIAFFLQHVIILRVINLTISFSAYFDHIWMIH